MLVMSVIMSVIFISVDFNNSLLHHSTLIVYQPNVFILM